MENSKFTESVFQDMKYNLQGRLSRFLILMHKIALKWPKSNQVKMGLLDMKRYGYRHVPLATLLATVRTVLFKVPTQCLTILDQYIHMYMYIVKQLIELFKWASNRGEPIYTLLNIGSSLTYNSIRIVMGGKKTI